MKRTFLDRALGIFSPRSELQRVRARAALEVFQKHFLKKSYEGASSGRRTSGWKTSSLSGTAAIQGALIKLRDRSRDLVRNNPWAKRAVDVIENNVVGEEIYTQFKVENNEKLQKKFKDLWEMWAYSTDCDYDGVNTMAGLQALAIRTIVESGEVLIRRRRAYAKDGLAVPIQLQVLEPDFLNTTIQKVAGKDGNEIIDGIEIDSRGKRVAYHLFEEHPGDSGSNFKGIMKSNRIDAKDVIHAYRVERTGQMRGVPWLSQVMLKLRDLDDYEDAQLLRQKISACFAVFINEPESLDVTTDPIKSEFDKIEPGMIEHLAPGREVKFATPPGTEGYKEYMSTVLHAVASGIGITFEALTQDFSQVNFSSGRMSWIEFHRNISSWRWRLMIPQVCAPITKWFFEASVLVGYNPTKVKAVWTPPRREMIDPTKEVPAQISAIRGGLKSFSQTAMENGNDPDELIEQLAKDNKMFDDKKLTLTSDARKTTDNGQKFDAPVGGISTNE